MTAMGPIFVVIACVLFACCAAFEDYAQAPIISRPTDTKDSTQSSASKLKGKFLHITDLHPDPFYKVYSATDEESACHRHIGPAGVYGAETSDCDSPFSLVNATFDWIDKNLKESVDFVVWTGDSARHDNDENFPRSVEQVLDQNKYLVDKMEEVFGNTDGRSAGNFAVPVVPTVGNNDIVPHNIFAEGPNQWTKSYAKLWKNLIPEEQRHSFERGAWFFVEVIPNKLAVFSLNTMYFFTSNDAVNGCASRSEPGYEHFEWLQIQLQLMRERGMKAIISGHVPPARTDEKVMWDETCWQKYTLWMRQYRDVVIGSLYGHMNIDHFMLQDFEDIDVKLLDTEGPGGAQSSHIDCAGGNGLHTAVSEPDYLESLRIIWSYLPSVPDTLRHRKKKKHNSKESKFFKRIGGEWGERYSLTLVSPSVVPNYYPTLRVFEYNITGLESSLEDKSSQLLKDQNLESTEIEGAPEFNIADLLIGDVDNKKRSKKPAFQVPRGPSRSSPPGPAYSPQSLSWIGYIQYFANLTYINNDFPETWSSSDSSDDKTPETQKWKHGKHHGKEPNRIRPTPREFEYEVEYDTRLEKDKFGLHDGLTVRSMIELASRIGGQSKSVATLTHTKKGKKHKKKKKKHHKNKDRRNNKPWHAFVTRALVSTVDPEDLYEDFA